MASCSGSLRAKNVWRVGKYEEEVPYRPALSLQSALKHQLGAAVEEWICGEMDLCFDSVVRALLCSCVYLVGVFKAEKDI